MRSSAGRASCVLRSMWTWWWICGPGLVVSTGSIRCWWLSVCDGSGPGVDGGGGWAQHGRERREVVWVAGEDVVAETEGGDHQVGVDDV